MVVAQRLRIVFEQVQLGATEREPLDRQSEARRRDRLGAEQVGVELDRLAKVLRVDADVIDPGAQTASSLPANGRYRS
jgi:hypothetical protein